MAESPASHGSGGAVRRPGRRPDNDRRVARLENRGLGVGSRPPGSIPAAHAWHTATLQPEHVLHLFTDGPQSLDVAAVHFGGRPAGIADVVQRLADLGPR